MNIEDYTQKEKTRIDNLVRKVNHLNATYKKVSSSLFAEKTEEFRERLRNGENVSNILVDALAVSREATKRCLGMFPYDTQVEAAIAMIANSSRGKDENGNMKDYYQRVIAEMKTGEGKTLVQILVSYINLLEATSNIDKSKWKSVHVMTSNDALAKRDSDSNGSVFEMLGFTCGYVPSKRGFKGKNDSEIIKYKKEQYACDIVYASPSTIAFDYLHDNIIMNLESRYINKPLGFALIDEADDILIDQATNPLKLSISNTNNYYEDALKQEQEERIKIYKWVTGFLYGQEGIRKDGLSFKEYDQFYKARKEIFVDEYDKFLFKTRREIFTEDYVYCKDTGDIFISNRIENELMRLFPKVEEYNTVYFALLNAISARHGFLKGREYNLEIKGNNADVVLIDQNIGRKKYSNKYSNGIQEAIEAKEEYMANIHKYAKKDYHVNFTKEKSVKAMFTYPDFLSIYDSRVSGMTGTSEEKELKTLYGFDTYKVETRKKNIRIDEEDQLYSTINSKYNAILKEVLRCKKTGQPVLIGTTTVEESVEVSNLLKKNGITHNLLNANNEEIENSIISTAGLFGSITVATNMAGRGVDIKLGPGVRELGGLLVIGTSKNKSVRIDTQLRGRAARQGDPGRSIYFYSLEDELIREQFKGNMLKFMIEHYDTNSAIKNKKVIKYAKYSQTLKQSKDELIREQTEKYNQPFISQRKTIYKQRNEVLESKTIDILKLIKSVVSKYANSLVENKSQDEIEVLVGHLVDVNSCYNKNKTIYKENLYNALWANIISRFDDDKSKRNETYKQMVEYAKKLGKIFLNIIDIYWINHIDTLENLRHSNAMASSSDPYKQFEYEANNIFYYELIPNIYNEMITYATNPSLRFGEYKIKHLEETSRTSRAML